MEITTLRGGPGSKVWKFSGKATVDGQAAAQAEFSAMIDPTGGKG
jgi:3-hydroxyacyl-[acyl-carrier-protein] dehydratase